MKTLKAANLKNKPRNIWQKYGFVVYHLHNGYWISSFNYSENFNTISEVKNKINQLRNL